MTQQNKRRPLRLLAVFCALGLVVSAGLLWPKSAAGAESASPTFPDATEFQSETPHETQLRNPVDERLFEGARTFSGRAASLLLDQGTDNSLCSPLSLWFALALSAESAGGETRTQLLSALGLPADYDLAPQTGNLFRRLYTDNEIGSLRIGNALWLNKDFSFHAPFLDTAVKDYYAALHRADFSDPKTEAALGAWLKEATGGLLGGKPVSLSPNDLMVLYSAVYYSDQWVNEFHAEDNIQGVFQNAGGALSQADYLSSRISAGYWRGDGYLAAGLPLKNNGSIYFLLPDEGKAPQDLLRDPEALAAALRPEETQFGILALQIPKFTVSDALDLKDALIALGVTDAFDPEKADFTPLSPDSPYLGDVRQEATLSIDEKGVTAAAYTEIRYYGGGMPEEEIPFVLDRPFLFAVVAQDGDLPLFVGVVNQI